MDMIKIGGFLKELRKEQGLTQEQLGEKLGTTGKTVSRWETGTYLPPVEMLQALSELYGLTINELLAAQRLTPEEAPSKAEENLAQLIKENHVFQLNEQKQYWRDKWLRDHRGTIILLIIAYAVSQLIGLMIDRIMLNATSSLIAIGIAVFFSNARDSYVEHHLYDEKLPQD